MSSEHRLLEHGPLEHGPLEHFERYWRGPILSLLGVAAVLWLAASGRLGWYVHPRYILFTVAMCLLAAAALIAAAPLLPRSGREAAARAPRPAERLRLLASLLLVAGSAAALLVAPPATLSVELAQQRQFGGAVASGAAIGDPGADATDATDGATVKSWALQLQRGGGTELEGQQASMLGFVLPDPEGSADVFLVARFAISCCAVDAQPLGVPVHSPGWRESFADGDWVTVEGVFVANPDVSSPHQTVLRPIELGRAEEPGDPYVY